MGQAPRPKKSTDVIRSKQRPRATYLPLISLAFRSDGVLYLTRQMKEIDLGVDSSEVSNGTRTKTREEVNMAGLGNNLVQVYRTGLLLHWVKFTFETGFELPSSWINLPCYGLNLNRNILDFMRWSQIDLGAQDLNGIQRPKSFQKSSWK